MYRILSLFSQLAVNLQHSISIFLKKIENEILNFKPFIYWKDVENFQYCIILIYNKENLILMIYFYIWLK